MNDYVITLIWGIGAFVAVFLVNYFIILKKGNVKVKGKKKQKKIEEFSGFSYLIPKFKLDVKKMDLKFVSILVSLVNAFIISAVIMIIFLVPWSTGFRMLLGFVLLFGLIYAMYEILGRFLVKKGWSK